MFPIVLRESW